MRFSFKNRKGLVRGGIAAAGVVLFFLIANHYIFPLPKETLFRPKATFVYSREGYLLSCFTSTDFYWRKPATLDDISPRLIQSVLKCEDRWFYFHPGFNPASLFLAAVDDIRAGKIVRGGSTISMQVARMMEPKPRTIPGKIIEIMRAVQLELNYSKKELLEIYFNMVPYGGNIEGVGAASYFYFDKTPDKLSWSEVAILTALPAAPSEFRPDRDLKTCTERRNRVLLHLREEGVISKDEYQAALSEEIPSMRIDPPFTAPHFCQTIAARNAGQAVINSTIDLKVQTICDRQAVNHQALINYKGIHNLSVVVIDNKTGELLGMVGSPVFTDTRHGGQINGALAQRSPGSAMKPFVYALAFEEGIISPEMMVEDIPVNYSGYIPENYDEKYHGVVSVSEALAQSLNVPAVNLTSRLGLKNYYDFLLVGGISTINRKYYDYGLPLVLGACEVNLLELTALYSTLARGGIYRPARMSSSDSTVSQKKILSPEVCFLVSDILSNLEHPDLPSNWEFTSDIPKVAWKTGTSYGRKDAWAIGYNPSYTVGVWAGNFNAEGSVDIVGAEIAAPLMLDIFAEISKGKNMRWFEQPKGVGIRKVCSVSGKPPTDNCPDTKEEYYLPERSPGEQCDVHKMLLVDKKTGYCLCRYCNFGREFEEMVYEEWPPKIATWLRDRGPSPLIPQHNPSCLAMVAGEKPVIESPESEAVYVIREQVPISYQGILFQSAAQSGSKLVHWFLDNIYYASSAPGSRVFYSPERGKHILLCLDDQGRSNSVRFEVK